MMRFLKKNDYTEKPLGKGEYDSCKFINCNFYNSNLSESRFINYEFRDCNLSSANIYNTSFQDVLFKDCKMLGISFDRCSDFGFAIKVNNCQLNHASFYQKPLPKTSFIESKLCSVDFSESSLSLSIFDNCDMQNAIFDNTYLKGADFKTAENFIINPERNQIKGAKFSLESVAGLLVNYNIKILM